MEELPVLAQGSKKVEVRMQLQLLTGYLRAAGTKASPAIAASVAMRRSLIRKYLAISPLLFNHT